MVSKFQILQIKFRGDVFNIIEYFTSITATHLYQSFCKSDL